MKCLGGDLQVEFLKRSKTYSEISITGPAKLVFEGTIGIQKTKLHRRTPIKTPSNHVRIKI